ncbi:hypothetical protein ES288_A06G106500v1 [Gossypium darwinii]|uniref:Transmembrane protein n=1 Tax=Gossypium darwinii TaxID=34276 RepID=A0A5D2G5T4_GOSDA|nr:hypothetical protein ES288_A06G106500v1 [Gossypium darwinii]
MEKAKAPSNRVFNFTLFFSHFHFIISCCCLPPLFPISKTQIPSSPHHHLRRSTSTDPPKSQLSVGHLQLASSSAQLLHFCFFLCSLGSLFFTVYYFITMYKCIYALVPIV